MPIANMFVDATTTSQELLSFMASFSSYNQILIKEEDIPKTNFRWTISIKKFEWMVIPFGLKNASVIYQMIMNVIFYNMLDHHMEV